MKKSSRHDDSWLDELESSSGAPDAAAPTEPESVDSSKKESSEPSETVSAKKPLTPKKAARIAKRSAKKAARIAKKKKKEAKKAVRLHSYAVLYQPERMNGFRFSIAVGYLLRFFSISFSIFGVIALLADSFAITGVNYWLLLLYSMLTVTAFSLIFIGRKLIFAGLGLLAATVGGVTLLAGSPAAFYVGGLIRVINQSMLRLSECGFAAIEPIAIPDLGPVGGIVGGDPNLILSFGGLCTVITLLAIIFSAFSAKRTRLFPMLLFGGGLCVICFTYNLATTNFGIICVLAGLCSAVVLSTYDKVYADHKHSRRSRGYSGFSSALAGLLTFAILLLPANMIHSPWRDIDFIANPMSDLRMVVTTILTGGNPKFNVMNSLIRKRSAKLEDVEFTETILFTADSKLRGQNLYLRGWVASDYDASADSWSVLSDKDYDAMLSELSKSRSGITGDQVNYLFASLFDESFAVDNLPVDSWAGSNDQGIYYTPVDIEYRANTGLLYVLPESYLPSVGFNAYGSPDERYSESVSLYSDGIYQSSWLNLRKSYRVSALTPTYRSDSFTELLKNRQQAFELLTDFFGNRTIFMREDEQVESEYLSVLLDAGLADREKVSASGVDGLPAYLRTPIRSYLESKNRRQWVTRYIDAVKEYQDYVKSFYTTAPTDSVGLQTVLSEIRPTFEAADNDYDRVLAVIDYLVLGYRYSLTPEKPSGAYESDLDSFLLETKEGYCVQFATAATLLLRSLGIPARYVQGYLADDAQRITEEDGTSYRSYVRDSDAHAWVEVWIDGMGWRTFETTPTYYRSMYPLVKGDSEIKDDISDILDVTTAPSEEVTTPDTEEVTPPVTTAPTDDPTSNPTEEEEFDPTVLYRILTVLCIAGVLLVLWLFIVGRSKKISAGRKYFIQRAVYGNFEDDADLDTVSGALGDGIYAMMKIFGHTPRVGETPIEFAYRVDHPNPPTTPQEEKAIGRQLLWEHTFTEVTLILEKREFGGHIERSELAVMGEFLESLDSIEYSALPFYKKIWYRYVLGRV